MAEKREILKGKNTVEIVRRRLTAAEQAQVEKSRAEVEADAESYLEEGRKRKRVSLQRREAAAVLADVMTALRAERDRQGISLADLTERTGIARSAISALENAEEPNPTISTVNRIAEALGVSVAVTLVPKVGK
jgi:ribosome-binding protein aMBF1 (putative translation factor)